MFKQLKAENKRASGTLKMPWRELLDHVDSIELWGSTKREDRDPWRQYFQEAEKLLMQPRTKIPGEMVSKILSGDFTTVDTGSIPSAQPRVVVFVSSTFTDTKAERNHLMKDVYPFVRKLSRRLGMDFVTVDMRWGVTEEATNDHSTVEMCVGEIKRCLKDSSGPAFLCFLGHKYGFRPLPPMIAQDEFKALLKYLKDKKKSTTLVESYYILDSNAVPAAYTLKQMPTGKDKGSWWVDVEQIQALFREAVVATFGASDNRCDKYHISVTEREVHEGIFNNPQSKDQVAIVLRDLSEFTSEFHRDRKIMDMKGKDIDEYAMNKQKDLKEEKLPKSVSKDVVFETSYQDPTPERCCNNIRGLCDHVCKTLTEGILQTYKKQLHVEKDFVFNEVIQHRNLANSKAELFVGKEKEIKEITKYACGQTKRKKPLVVHGVSGCGKTALMAMSARYVKEQKPGSVVVMRFLGTTGQSGAARAVLLSVITQICRIYGQGIENIPTSYKDLIQYFRQCMLFATVEKPLVIFLDSLDQLSNEDFGQNLAWLCLNEDIPDNVTLVLSCLPTQCLDILRDRLPKDSFVEVCRLTMQEGPDIVTKMLTLAKRTVTSDQKKIILNAFEKCPLPLFLRLVVDIVIEWRSFDEIKPSSLADSMQGLITMLFERIEHRYGKRFVHRTFSYLTAAKFGLSLNELEDVLSCDDEVLDDIFKFWVPPVRRIPSMLWARVRSEIGPYLVEKGTDGINTYGWFHRQFWETAEKRYLLEIFGDEKEPFKAKAHKALADYFEGKYEAGKLHVPASGKQKFEDRKVPQQPIVVGGSRSMGRQLNRRKLSELPYHLVNLKDWGQFKTLALDLKYIEAKFEADMGYTCLSEFIEATRLSEDVDLQQMTRFIGSNLSFLIKEPYAVYQLALQQSTKHIARGLMDKTEQWDLLVSLMKNTCETEYDDPCEMTLIGHTETLRCCAFSPKGDLIASAADDCTMRIWDALTGAELVTVSGLPGAIAPAKTESQQLVLHPVNPCCFSRDGTRLASGTETGSVKLWSTSGAELKSADTPNNQVTFIKFSPDNSLVAAVHRDSTVSFWKGDDLTNLRYLKTGTGETTGLDFSHNGNLVAVTSSTSLVQISTKDFSIVTNTRSQYMNLCCTYYKDDVQVMTGGSDSRVTVWDVPSGRAVDHLSSHRAWIWSIAFTSDGQYMFTGSSDRSMKIWRYTGQWNAITSVGGHSHRVSMVSIESQTERRIVTSSLDRSLKVWDVKTLLTGQLPPVAGLHYNVCLTSTSGRYLVSSQGWHTQSFVYQVDGMKQLGMTPTHNGFIRDIAIPEDETILLVLDHGHKGAYETGAEKNASVRVVSLPNVSLITTLPVTSPMGMCVNEKFIFVYSNSEGTIHQYKREDMSEITSWKFGTPGQGVTLAATYKQDVLLASCGKDASIYRSTSSGPFKVLQTLDALDSHIGISNFSPVVNHLALGLTSGKVVTYKYQGQQFRMNQVLTKNTDYVKDIRFSSDGRYMLTSAGLTMRVWDMDNDVMLVSTYYAPVNRACFLGDYRIVAGEATGTLTQLTFDGMDPKKIEDLKKVSEVSASDEHAAKSRRARKKAPPLPQQ